MYWDRVRTERTLAKGKYQEGRTEGKIEGKIETAQAMLAAGLSLADTMKITGLTEEQIHVPV